MIDRQTIIKTPEEVTPSWVTSILHRSGLARSSEVSSVDITVRRELPYSTVCRLGIEYLNETPDSDRPQSLFLKLCGSMEKSDGLEDIGRKEVDFYRRAAPAMSCPPLVRCYDAAYSEDLQHSHILLEDLTKTHSQPDQEQAPSVDLSRLAVEALAKAHRSWWNSPKLGNGIGNVFDGEWLRRFVVDLNKTVSEFLKIAELTDKQKDAYRLLLNAAPQIWGRLTQPDHLTITHGDTHWWNFLYPKDPDTHSVHLFDWHLWHVDLGARDLAFLLALGGFAEPRPEIEEGLLRIYHKNLDVAGYSWGMLIEDYRWSAIRNLNIPVIFRMQGKHEHTWRTALQRAFNAYERLGCSGLIGGG